MASDISKTTSTPASGTIAKLCDAQHRKMAIVFNSDPAQDLRVKMSNEVMVDNDDFTQIIPAMQGYEIPKEYVGAVWGVWTAASSAPATCKVTEVV